MMQDDTYDVIIVGGGPNGLCCGAYLARAGAKTLILEKKWETGGGLATDDFNSPFRFNLHAIYMMLADWAPAHKDLELDRNNLEYIFPEAQVAFHHKDGKALVFYLDPARTIKSLAAFSEKDARAFENMHAEFKAFCDEILIPATYVPPMPALDNVVLLNRTPLGQRLVQVSEKTPEEIVEHYGFVDERVRAALLYLATMWGLKPDEPGVGYLVPLWIYRIMNTALVRGGSHTLSSAIHNAFKLAGGKVLEWTCVKEILIEGGKAVGVRIEDGREFRARVIVSTLNPQQTFLECISEEHLPHDLGDTTRQWQWEGISLFTAHYGIKGNPPGYHTAQFNPDANSALINVFGIEKPEDIHRHQQSIQAGELGASHGHATCTTVFDPHQASCSRLYGPLHTLRFETWASYDLKGKVWDEVKRDYSRQCLELWQEYAPNLKEAKVLFEFAYSPLDIERRLVTMKRGSFKHGAYNLFQMGYLRPNHRCSRYRTPLKGLYLAGASVYPGGLILLGSGYNAARVIAEDLSLHVWWAPPDYVLAAQQKGYLPVEKPREEPGPP